MPADYFTFDEFLAYVGPDANVKQKYVEATVLEVQDVVVTILEEWADTAWRLRTVTEYFDGGGRRLLLARYPVTAVTEFLHTADNSAVSGTAYVLESEDGMVIFNTRTLTGPRAYKITYTYGFAAPTAPVKRCAMNATRKLLDSESPGGRIPSRTTRYTTQGTTFEMSDDDKKKGPWPWAPEASRIIRLYWGRAPRVGVAGGHYPRRALSDAF